MNNRESGRKITRTFMAEGKVQSDFTGDPEIDVWDYSRVKDNEIEFRDTGGTACNNPGRYSFRISGSRLTFTMLDDICSGRNSGLSGTRKKSECIFENP